MKFSLPFRRKHAALPLWADYSIVALASVIYAAIAAIGTGSESSYFDEGFTSYLARFSPLDIAHYTALDVHPPLYYIVLHYWQQLVGINVFNLRFLSILWGIIAIVFAFLLAQKLFGRRAAWSTLLFVVLSPLFIRYSEAMRMYTMALAIVTAGTYIFARLVITKDVKRTKRAWGIYAVIVSAGMWTNYFTAFVWVSHFIWLQTESYRMRKSKLKKPVQKQLNAWYIAVAGAVLLYLPWLPWLILRFSDVQSTGFWIKPISIDTLVSTVTTAITYKSASQVVSWGALIVVAYIAIVSWVIWRAYKSMNDSQRASYRLIIFCAVIPVVALVLLSMPPFRSSYVYRYVLNGLFISTIVVGVGFAAIRFKRDVVVKHIALYTVAFVVLGMGVFAAKESGNRSLDTGVKNMVAQAIDTIHAHAQPGEPIVSRSPYTYYTASLYETKDHPVYYTYSSALNKVGSTHMLYDHPQARGIKNIANFAGEHSKLWIIAEDRGSAMTPPVREWKRTQLFVLRDPVTKVPTSYAAEYTKP